MVLRNETELGPAAGMVEGLKRSSRTDGAIRVWLVDDSENFRVLLSELLEEEGGLTCAGQFSTAEEALEALEHQDPPDVMLLDLRMPGMGGLAAVRPIRDRAPGTHVLMLTTFGDMDSRARAMDDGATDFLLKSYDFARIACRIKSAMESKPPALVPIGGIRGNERPTSRAPGGNDVAPDIQRIQHPAAGPRKQAGGGECVPNRLVRGVHVIRDLFAHAMGRHSTGKAVGT